MAKRRRGWGKGARLAYGLAEGSSQLFAQMMRQMAADKAAERTSAMQEARDMRTLERQERIQARGQREGRRTKALEHLTKVYSGELEPDVFMSMFGADLMPESSYGEDFVGTGEPQREAEANAQGIASLVEGARPPLRRKLEKTVGESIGKATSPEQLVESDVLGQILAADPRVRPEEDEPGMRVGGLHPEAYEYVARAEDKAQALRSKPNERVDIPNPDGSKTTKMLSSYDLADGVTTGLSAQQEGALAGTKEKATLGVVGGARAAQAGREAGAREQAAIDVKLSNAKKLIDFETQQALAKLKTIPLEVDARKAAEGIAEARQAALAAAPAIGRLQKLWLNAQPTIAAMAFTGTRAELGARESFQPSSTLPQNVKDYVDLTDAVRPMLAKAFGQAGNPALAEQEWAKYVGNFSDAHNPDAALMKFARLEALLTSQVALREAAQAKGAPLDPAEIDAIVETRVQGAFNALKEMEAEMGVAPAPMGSPAPGTSNDLSGIEFAVTPTGMELRRGGSQ